MTSKMTEDLRKKVEDKTMKTTRITNPKIQDTLDKIAQSGGVTADQVQEDNIDTMDILYLKRLGLIDWRGTKADGKWVAV